MSIGIRNIYQVAADVAITSSTTLVTVGLKSPIAANATQHFRCQVPISVGASGGVRMQAVVPAGGSAFLATIQLYNTVAPSTTTAVQTSSAAFTNALANAGNHWIECDIFVVNGATAGNVDLQFAQDTADANTLTVLKGGKMEVVKL